MPTRYTKSDQAETRDRHEGPQIAQAEERCRPDVGSCFMSKEPVPRAARPANLEDSERETQSPLGCHRRGDNTYVCIRICKAHQATKGGDTNTSSENPQSPPGRHRQRDVRLLIILRP